MNILIYLRTLFIMFSIIRKKLVGLPTQIIFSMNLILIASTANAAFDIYEAFDAKRCIHWIVTNDIASYDHPDYKKAKELASRMGVNWNVYQANGTFGTCTLVDVNKKLGLVGLQCLAIEHFPLGGGTYHPANNKDGQLSYKCVKGCGEVSIRLFYDMGYEEDARGRFYKIEETTFNKKCNRGN